MLYAGLIVFVLGGIVMLVGQQKKKTQNVFAQGQSVNIQQLIPDRANEIQGTIVSTKQPLKTPFSEKDCAYYEYELQSEKVTQNKEGKEQRKWERVGKGDQAVPFIVKDRTGQVLVYPEGAEIEAKTLGKKVMEIGRDLKNPIFRNVVNLMAGHRNRVEERALLINSPIYIFGYATKTDEGMVFERSNSKYFMSYKSEKQVEKELGRKAALFKVLGIIGLAAGLAAVVYSFIN